ncbi:hypothetical protein RI367_004891 [Sorochytrium milnesiophthora]
MSLPGATSVPTSPKVRSSMRILTSTTVTSPAVSPLPSPLPAHVRTSVASTMSASYTALPHSSDSADSLRPRRGRSQRSGSIAEREPRHSSIDRKRPLPFNSVMALGDDSPQSGRAKLTRGAWRLLWLVVHSALFVTLVFVVALVANAKYGSAPVDYSALTGKDINWSVDVRQLNLTPFNASFGSYNVILDAHSHTTVSDGRMTPETLLDYAIAQGYNALVVSDHNTIEGGLEAERIAKSKFPDGRLVVIPAVEYTCCRIHMNLIGINETIAPPRPYPTDDEMRAAIARTHQLGGIAIVNHIPWSNTLESGYELYPNGTGRRLPGQPTRDQLLAMGIDGIEISNQDTFDLVSVQYAQQHGLIMVTGSDVHYPDGNAGWTLIRTPPSNGAVVSKDDIMQALRSRQNTFVFDASITPYRIATLDQHTNPTYTFMSPLLEMGSYAQDMVFTVYQGMYSFVPATVAPGVNTTDLPASETAPRVAMDNPFCHPKIIQTHPSSLASFICWTAMFVLGYFGLVLLAGRELKKRFAYWRWSNRQWAQHAEALAV